MKRVVLGLLCVWAVCSVAFGQTVLLGWDVGGQAKPGENPFAPGTTAAGISSSGLFYASGLNGTGADYTWGSRSWNVADADTAIASNKFITFTVEPQPGKGVTVTNCYIAYTRSAAAGPPEGILQYKIGNGEYQTIATNAWASGDSTTNIPINLTTPVTEVITFRIVNYGASTAGGTWYIRSLSGNDFILTGSVQDVGPVPLSAAITGAADEFTVAQGSSVTLTASATGGTSPYRYAWTTTMDSSTGSAETFLIAPALSTAIGNYTVSLAVTDDESDTDTATLHFSVVAPPVTYAIACETVDNGSLSTDKTTAEAGETISVTVTPNSGYQLQADSLAYNGNPISGNTFVMPAEDVVVTAIFEPLNDTATLPTFFSGAAAGALTWTDGGMPAGWTQSGLTVTTGENYDGVGGAGASFGAVNRWLQIKYDQPAGELTYWLRLYTGTWLATKVFTVQESVDGNTWTTLALFNEANPIPGNATFYTSTPAPASRYVRFIYSNRGTSGNIAIDGVTLTAQRDPEELSISFDCDPIFELDEGEALDITATVTGGLAPYDYEWETDMPDGDYSTADNIFRILDTAAPGTYYAMLRVTDANEEDAVDSVDFTINPFTPPDPVTRVDISSMTLSGGNISLGITTDPSDAEVNITVQGASAVVDSAWDFTPLTEGTDYTLSGKIVTLTPSASSQMICVDVSAP